MSVKVLISRRISKEMEPVLRPFLAELHALAWRSKGYISGETLINANDSEDYIVISSWQSVAEWESFQNQPETRQLHIKIDQILKQATRFTVYRNK